MQNKIEQISKYLNLVMRLPRQCEAKCGTLVKLIYDIEYYMMIVMI